MKVRIISVPYDSGIKDARMGAGPRRLLQLGLESRVAEEGHEVETTELSLPDGFFPAEVKAAIELDRQVAAAVTTALDDDEFPLILSGNCNSSLGTIAGLGLTRLGVVWFDAHGDFNTPETSESGFFDGMALAIVSGRCWQPAAETIPGFRRVPDNRIAIVGARHIDPGERALLESSEVTLVAADEVKELRMLLDNIDAREIYLHIDLDVLDESEGRANTYAVGGGLSASELHYCIEVLAGRFLIRGAALTAYDPSADSDGRVGKIALSTATQILSAVANPP